METCALVEMTDEQKEKGAAWVELLVVKLRTWWVARQKYRQKTSKEFHIIDQQNGLKSGIVAKGNILGGNYRMGKHRTRCSFLADKCARKTLYNRSNTSGVWALSNTTLGTTAIAIFYGLLAGFINNTARKPYDH